MIKSEIQEPGIGDPSNGAADEVEKLKKDFTKLRSDVVTLFGDAFGVGKEGLGAVGQSATDAMEHLKENLKDRVTHMKQRGKDSVSAASKKIEDNPVSSALIAFGVGFIVAKMLSRRS